MPLAFDRGLRSLTSTTFPASSSFDYPAPANAPVYGNFPNNDGDRSLDSAQEGYIFQLTGNDLRYAWVKWNSGIDGGNTTLANSLAWPGDAWDYADYGDTGSAFTSEWSHVVRGFVEVGQTDDHSLHIPDRVSSNETATMSGVTTQLQDHIDSGRALRLIALPVGGGAPRYMPAPDNRPYHSVDGFAIFRLHGYSLAEDWILVEFIGWDNSCGQTS
jgi:hypothetical protein